MTWGEGRHASWRSFPNSLREYVYTLPRCKLSGLRWSNQLSNDLRRAHRREYVYESLHTHIFEPVGFLGEYRNRNRRLLRHRLLHIWTCLRSIGHVQRAWILVPMRPFG